MHVYVWGHMCTCMCIHFCVHVCGCQRTALDIIFSEIGFLVGLKLTTSSRLTDQ